MSEKDIRALLAKVERALGAEWVDVADWLRGIDANSLDAIEARLVAGDFRGIVAEVESAARRFAAAMNEGYQAGGKAASKWLDDQVADKLIRFDAVNDRAVIAARRNEIELVQGLAAETRQNVRQALVDGQTRGLNPRTIARDIRDGIGLTPNQEQHVRNYRRALETGDFGNALGRELRDARSDRTLHRLAGDGGKLTEQQVDKMVERYRKNYITYRAETIARTESARNVGAGIEEGMRQAIERGDVEADQLLREWIAGPRVKDARPDHAAMDGKQVKFGEPFVFSDGTRKMFPGDGNGGAKHDANCRCAIATVLMPS